MTIGSLGDVAFTLSDKKAMVLKNLQWKSTANYTTHKLVNKTGVMEFTGLNPDEISFDVELSAYFKINPEKSLAKLKKMLEGGKEVIFILGDSRIGNKWVLTSVQRKATHYWKTGAVTAYTVSLTIKEQRVTKKATSSTTTTSTTTSTTTTTTYGGTGWKRIDGKWYYYENGTKVTGWKYVSGAWYYMDAQGVKQTGWLKYNERWYYLNPAANGARATSVTLIIEGKAYTFDSAGRCTNKT